MFDISNNVLYDCYPEPDETEVVIPEGVTLIGTYAFEKCNSLKSVTIPDSVTKILDWAFEGCPLEEFHILGEKRKLLIGEALGYEMPDGLRDSMVELLPYMDDCCLDSYVLSKIDSCDDALLNKIANEMLGQIRRNPNAKYCRSAASYVVIYYRHLDADVMRGIYKTFKEANKSKKAIQAIESEE